MNRKIFGMSCAVIVASFALIAAMSTPMLAQGGKKHSHAKPRTYVSMYNDIAMLVPSQKVEDASKFNDGVYVDNITFEDKSCVQCYRMKWFMSPSDLASVGLQMNSLFEQQMGQDDLQVQFTNKNTTWKNLPAFIALDVLLKDGKPRLYGSILYAIKDKFLYIFSVIGAKTSKLTQADDALKSVFWKNSLTVYKDVTVREEQKCRYCFGSGIRADPQGLLKGVNGVAICTGCGGKGKVIVKNTYRVRR